MLVVLFSVSLILVILVFMIFYVLSYKVEKDYEGVTGYECGYELMCKARVMFSYRFFLIVILFLIFDVEVVLMLPSPYCGSILMFLGFCFVLLMGLVYEYYWGSLNWL